MLYSVEDYGIDIEFSMLTVGCLQNPKDVFEKRLRSANADRERGKGEESELRKGGREQRVAKRNESAENGKN